MEHWELVARESIRDLVARYNSNGDSGRFDQVMELFAPDATMDVDGTAYEGRDQIRGMFVSTAEGLKVRTGPLRLRHFTATLQIDLETPESASSRCYYALLLDRGLDHWGRYLDRFRIVEGRWKFAHRREIRDGAVPDGWGATATPVPPA